MESKYFMLSNGSYCHVLPDKIIFTDNKIIENIPPMNHHTNNRQTGLFISCLLAVIVIFTYLYFKQDAPVEFIVVLFPLCIAGIFYLIRNRDLSTTSSIEIKYIKNVSLKLKEMGYTIISILFETNTGGTLRKRIKVYDTPDQEQKAVQILKEEGLIKTV